MAVNKYSLFAEKGLHQVKIVKLTYFTYGTGSMMDHVQNDASQLELRLHR